jgi:hypothetical protein
MFRGAKEYSLEELIEHPSLSLQLTSDGIERRCLDLMLDTIGTRRRSADAEPDQPLPD